MSITVFIDGAAGTTGLEIGERLRDRASIRLAILPDDRRKDPEARRQALNDADIVILCLPDAAALDAVALIDNDRTRVIDASSAHRVANGWTYGFPELGFDVADARRVSNPGCYPTGFLALVAPLVRAGLVPRDWPLAVRGTSGYSGGGKAMIAEFESGGADTAYRTYALDLVHKHVPEMQRHAGLDHAPIFLPAVANTYRGMVIEVPLHTALLPGKPGVATIRNVLAEAMAGPLIRVASAAPATIGIEERAGTDGMTLYVTGNDATGHVRLTATLDNLGKGAAGAAVQSLNLLAGFDETEGLIL